MDRGAVLRAGDGWGPTEAQRSGFGGERRSKEASGVFARAETERCGLCDDDAGPVLVYGISASMIYGILLWIVG